MNWFRGFTDRPIQRDVIDAHREATQGARRLADADTSVSDTAKQLLVRLQKREK